MATSGWSHAASARRSRCCSRISNASSDSTDYDYAGRTAPVTSSTSPLQPRTSASSPSLFHSPCTPCQPDPRHRPAVPRRLVCLSHQRTFSTTSAESGMSASEQVACRPGRPPSAHGGCDFLSRPANGCDPPSCGAPPSRQRTGGWPAEKRLSVGSPNSPKCSSAAASTHDEAQLESDIHAFIERHDGIPCSTGWTKSADETLSSVKGSCQRAPGGT